MDSSKVSVQRLTVDARGTPAYFVEVESSQAGIVLLHSYGGNKEEMLGLGARIAEEGFSSLAGDLVGHGENPEPMSAQLAENARQCLYFMREKYGRVAAVGFSMGGRLAFFTEADVVVAISPGSSNPPAERLKETIAMRGHRVRESPPTLTHDIINELGEVPFRERPTLIAYGEHDIADIIEGAKKLIAHIPGSEYLFIPNTYHSQIMTSSEVLEKVPRWLKSKLR